MSEIIKSKLAGAAITAHSFVIGGSADNQAVLASAATSKILGVSGALGADAGRPVDITILGIAPVKLGGTVVMGDHLTSNASGLAVELTGVLTGDSIGRSAGIALASGVSGDIIDMLVVPHSVAEFA